MSLQFLGTQIDAVYHTAIVFGEREYFFGAGVQTTVSIFGFSQTLVAGAFFFGMPEANEISPKLASI